MVSDDFFREHSSLDLSFDLIGVGEFYQFNRILHGFRQGLEYSHGRTIFILNNTFPISRAAALPDHDDYMAARQETEIGRAHVCTPVTDQPRMPSSA